VRRGALRRLAAVALALASACSSGREPATNEPAGDTATRDGTPSGGHVLVGVYFRVDSMPPGWRWEGGGQPVGDGFARGVRRFEGDAQHLLIYDSAFQDPARYGLHRVLDVLEFARGRFGDSLTIAWCEVQRDVFAVVPNDGRTGRLDVRRAWRADSATGRWVELAPAATECVRLGEMQ
jgi:hypothetical protein